MKTLKLFIITSILLINNFKTIACGPCYTNEAYQFYLFQPFVSNNPDAYLFYYNPYSYYNDNLAHKTTGPIENLKEWQGYLGKECSLDEIDNLIYKFSLSKKKHTGVFGLYNLINDLANYKLTQQLVKADKFDVINYILFTKKCEAKLLQNDWYSSEDNYIVNEDLIAISNSLKEKTNDAFLNYRYDYQRIVLEYYKESNTNEIKVLYDKFEKNYPTKILTQWAKFFANTNTELTKENIINLAEVFENCDYKKLRINTITPNKESDLYNDAYQAANNQQKAALIAIHSFRSENYDIENLKKIQRLNPLSKSLPFLITREINTIEEHFYAYKIHPDFGNFEHSDNYWSKSRQEKEKEDQKNYQKIKHESIKNLTQLNELLKICLSNNNTLNLDFYHTAYAYSNHLLGNTQECNKHLIIAKNNNPSYLIKKQLDIIDLINSFDSKTFNSEEYAAKLMSVFYDSSHLTQNYSDSYNYYDDNTNHNIKVHQNHIVLYLMNKLIDYDKLAYAGLLQSVNDYTTFFQTCSGFDTENYFFFFENHLSLKHVNEAIEIIEKKDKTPFENLICKKIDNNKLYDLQGTLLMREYDFEKAIHSLNKIDKEYFKPDTLRYIRGKEYIKYLDCNPFHAFFAEKHEKDPKYDTISYNKLEFAQKMQNLINTSVNGNLKEDSLSFVYYQLANAFYNMTYYGNSWAYSRYHSSREYLELDEWPYTYNNDDFKTNYYGCTKAIEYYTKALNTSKKEAFKALCLRMLGKCETRRTNKTWNKYDQELFTNFPKHEKLINNCESIDDYLMTWKQ